MFQSAPLTGARGDECRQLWIFGTICNGVSIRSPHRSEGRPMNRRQPSQGIGILSFQSAPLTGARGDHAGWKSTFYQEAARRCFNPLPSPERGETLVVVTSQQSESYTGICANRSNSCPSNLIQLSTNGATSCDADPCERRETTGTTPSLWVRTSYKTSGPVKSTGSLTP